MTNLTLHLLASLQVFCVSKTLHLVVRSALCWRISLPLILHASLPRYSLTATFVLLSFSLYIGPARSQTALQSFILLTCLQLHINYNLNNCLSVRCLFFNRERSEGVCTLTPFNANQKTAYSIFPILLTIVLPYIQKHQINPTRCVKQRTANRQLLIINSLNMTLWVYGNRD